MKGSQVTSHEDPSTSSEATPLVTVEHVRDLIRTYSEQEGKERLAAQLAEGIVNPIMLADFLGIRPQMIYNYIRNGRIATREHNSTQKLVIPLHDAIVFAAQQLNRRAEKQDKIERELRGE